LNTELLNQTLENVTTTLTGVAFKALGALVLYLFGRWLMLSSTIQNFSANPVLAVRPYTHTHYWQVHFDTNKAIVAVGGEGKYPPVERTLKMKQPA
jgi:hypothetical protein